MDVCFERRLAEWAISLPNAHTEQALVRVQNAFLDVTACIVGGSRETPTQMAIQAAKRFGRGASLALGSDLRLPAPWAAFVGGTAAHALDFDDNFAPATTHATAVLAPALFALAEEEGLSGADVVDAYIVGLELQGRIGRLVNPCHYEKGWHATSTVGTIGTAGACARLLRLSRDAMLASMSIASSMAGGSKKQFGSMVKPIHAGLAAKNAVLAARLAQSGATGDTEPLSGRWGFAELYGERAPDEATQKQALAGLGTHLLIDTEGLLPKRFPCCGAAHRTLDGLVALRERHSLSLDTVAYVDVFIPAFARANLRYDDPVDETEARFSLTYCAARVLQTGCLKLADLTLARVRDTSIRPWLSRFIIHVKGGSVSDELGENPTPAVTRAVLQSGQQFEIGIVVPKGAPQAPFTESEMREKFSDCCRWGGKAGQAERLFNVARSIPRQSHFSEFTREFSACFAA